MFENFIKEVITEYGSFIGFLLLNNLILGYVIKILWKRNEYLSDKLIETIEHTTAVLSTLKERISGTGE